MIGQLILGTISRHMEEKKLLERVQHRACKRIQGTGTSFFEERLRELDVFSTEKT